MPEQNDERRSQARRDSAVSELVWLLTKAGPFGSPRERAENLLDAIDQGGAVYAYIDTLAAAMGEVNAGLAEGVMCPCCGQRCQAYHRKLNSGMASALITVWVRCGTDWAHIPDIAARIGGDFAKLRHWGLVQESLGRREDGGRQGDWRILPKGSEFVRGLITVQSHVTIYNNLVLGMDGPHIGIREALGDRFNYDELMRGV